MVGGENGRCVVARFLFRRYPPEYPATDLDDAEGIVDRVVRSLIDHERIAERHRLADSGKSAEGMERESIRTIAEDRAGE